MEHVHVYHTDARLIAGPLFTCGRKIFCSVPTPNKYYTAAVLAPSLVACCGERREQLRSDGVLAGPGLSDTY